MFAENDATVAMAKDEMIRFMNLPNCDMVIDDIEKIARKPVMPPTKKKSITRHVKTLSNDQGQSAQRNNVSPEDKKPLSPVIRRSAINNLVNSPGG